MSTEPIGEDVRSSVGRGEKITLNLANKYRPHSFDDIVEQSIVMDMIRKFCESPKLDNRNFLLIGPAGTGKAQPLDSKVLTPTGFIDMRDVEVGTEVFTGNGNIAKVSGVYPQGVRDIYEIELQDRTVIRVSDEHLNVFYWYNENKKQREDYCMTTTELYEYFHNTTRKLRIDIPFVDWDKPELPIDPYLLGTLIGDGSLSGNFGFSNDEDDVVAKVDSILRRDWDKYLRKRPGNNVDYRISSVNDTTHRYMFTYKGELFPTSESMSKKLVDEGYPKFSCNTLVQLAKNDAKIILKKYPELSGTISVSINPNYRYQTEGNPLKNILRDMGLLVRSSMKHIPKEYLYADRETRLQLLQGLYDTDGYTSNEGETIFTTCSDQLSEDFAFLVRSLGIRDTVVDYPSKYKKNGEYIYTGTTAHDHNIKIPNDLPFCTSEKHLSRRRDRQNPPMRNIIDVRKVGREECQCIMVDHPDHTYISDGFIPTHNTTTARIMANVLNEGRGELIELDAASNGNVESIMQIVEQARTYPVDSKYKIFIIDEVHSISTQGFQKFLKTLEESPAKSVFILCTTNPEKIPATILSRVQTFQLSKISVDGIASRLKHIIECENAEGRNITYTDDAVYFIAKTANGGLRDACTLLDKALAYSENITSEGLVVALNLPHYDDYFALLSAYAKHDNVEISKIINRVYNSGVNFVKWFEGFHSFIINIMKYVFIQDINATMIPAHYIDKLSKYGPNHAIVCLRLANKLIKLLAELKTTNYLQEVALTYLCTVPQKKGE